MTSAPDSVPLPRIAAAALDALSGGSPCVSGVVLEADSPAAGARRILVREGRLEGTLGDGSADAELIEAADRLLRSPAAADTVEIEAAGGHRTVYLEAHRPPARLVIVGAGHIAQPLAALGARIGFHVAVLDDRPEFAVRERFGEAEVVARIDLDDPFAQVPLDAGSHLVLVTRGHKYDFEILRRLLREPAQPAYIGMVGSRRRVRACFEQLAAEGVSADRLARIHAPIGLDIGAETPEEIAVSIAAELVLVRRGGTGRPLRDLARVVELWIEKGATNATNENNEDSAG